MKNKVKLIGIAIIAIIGLLITACGDGDTHEFKIEMDDNVKDFLMSIYEADKVREKLTMTDKVYDLLITGLKEEFNEKNKSTDKKFTQYEMVTMQNKKKQEVKRLNKMQDAYKGE